MTKNNLFVIIITLCLMNTPNYASGISNFEKSHISILPTEQENLSRKFVKNAIINLKAGHYRKAHKFILKAIEINKKHYGYTHNELGSQSLKFAINLSHITNPNLAIGAYSRAKKMNKKSTSLMTTIIINNNHALISINLINKAKYLSSEKKYNEANLSFLDAQIIFESVFGSKHPTVAQITAERAELFFKQEQFTKAKILILKANNTFNSYFQKNHPLQLNTKRMHKDIIEKEPHFDEINM